MMFALALSEELYPVALMHGFGDQPSIFDNINAWLLEQNPNQYVYNIPFTGEYSKDNSIDVQCKELQRILKADPKMKNGFIACGFSQGGVVFRHYIQVYNDPPVKRLITLASPLSGIYTTNPDHLAGQAAILLKDPYSDENFEKLAAASWWFDPFDFEGYRTKNKGLALLDNLREYSEQRRQNFMSLEQLVLCGSRTDSVLYPSMAAFFNYYKSGSNKDTEWYFEREIFTKDLFGLKTLFEQNKVYTYHSNFNHGQYHQPAHKDFFLSIKHHFVKVVE